MERLNINKNKGITLIALVITVIVLLILAGVSIAMLTGENGILNQAKKAKEETEIASEEEKVKLATSAALLQDNAGSIIQSNLQSELSKYFDTEDFSVLSGTNDEGKNGFIVTVTENVEEGRKYFVSQNGNIEKYEEPQVAELTDIYLNLYDDGTLVFSNNSELMEGKTLEKSYGNIKGKTFGSEQTGNTMTIRLPYITIENITEDKQEEAMNQLMTEASKIKKVVIENEIVPDSMAYWFFGLINLNEISGIENLDTSNVTDMSYMFNNCNTISNIDLSSFNTSNVTDMNNMFCNCRNLTSLDLSSFNTNKVTDMNSMFFDCNNLITLNLSNFDTSNVIDMEGMFCQCYKLKGLDLRNFDTSNVINMKNMFADCAYFNNDNNWGIENWNVSKVIDFSYMFREGTEKISWDSLDLSNWDISLEADVSSMFQERFEPYRTIYVKNGSIKQYLEQNAGEENTYSVK